MLQKTLFPRLKSDLELLKKQMRAEVHLLSKEVVRSMNEVEAKIQKGEMNAEFQAKWEQRERQHLRELEAAVKATRVEMEVMGGGKLRAKVEQLE